jgi:prevent-host-death family protein
VTITTLTSREFNQDASKAKQAAESGPVVITDRGRPAHVLLTFAQYKKLTSQRAKIADLLAVPGVEDIELPIRRRRELARAADLG